MTLSSACVPYYNDDDDYRRDRYGRYDRYDRDDRSYDRYGRYDRDDWRMNATVTAIGVAIATIVTMTGATVDEAIETSRSTTRRGTQADRLRSRRHGAEL